MGDRMSKQRLIVIGGDAAGMSAASQARRRNLKLEIIAFERGSYTSYSA
jgi:NADPH-dependent 2,4-dienoyl-CoA reductase/sulfur reductase-like enzyme